MTDTYLANLHKLQMVPGEELPYPRDSIIGKVESWSKKYAGWRIVVQPLQYGFPGDKCLFHAGVVVLVTPDRIPVELQAKMTVDMRVAMLVDPKMGLCRIISEYKGEYDV